MHYSLILEHGYACGRMINTAHANGPIVGEHETGSTMRYRIYNDAGYVLYDPKTGVGEYRFYIRDHLGNVRVETDSDGNVVRAVDYTASGIPVERRWLADPGPECFGGLAYYDELGNGWYDNNTRVMESLLMRFTAMDPLCEKYPAISPYANSLCNPLRFSDPTGKEVITLYDPRKNKVIEDMFKNNAFNDDPNTIHIFAHGSKDGMQTVDFNGGRTDSTEGLVNVLNSKSAIWKNRNDNEPVTIILHSCQTGSGEDSFAAKISEELDNVTVIAPNGDVRLSKNGEMGVFMSKSDEQNVYGNWNVFENGNQSMQLSGKSDPRVFYFKQMYNDIKKAFNNLKENILNK